MQYCLYRLFPNITDSIDWHIIHIMLYTYHRYINYRCIRSVGWVCIKSIRIKWYSVCFLMAKCILITAIIFARIPFHVMLLEQVWIASQMHSQINVRRYYYSTSNRCICFKITLFSHVFVVDAAAAVYVNISVNIWMLFTRAFATLFTLFFDFRLQFSSKQAPSMINHNFAELHKWIVMKLPTWYRNGRIMACEYPITTKMYSEWKTKGRKRVFVWCRHSHICTYLLRKFH